MSYAKEDKTLHPLQVACDDYGNFYVAMPKTDAWVTIDFECFTPLMNEEQVAACLSVSTHAVRKWRREGKIGHVKLSGAVRFEFSEVLSFIDRNRRAADHASVA
jgi:hypothetical protein